MLRATAHPSDKYCTQCPFTAFYLPLSDFSRNKLKKARAKSVQVINVTRLEKLLKGHLSFGSLKDLQKLSSDDICPGTSVNISQDKSNSKKKNKGSGSLEKACLEALLMDPSSGIQSLSTRQIHQSCIEFKSMSFNKFSDRLEWLRRGYKSEKKALEQELAEFKKHKKALSNGILPSGTIY